MPTEYQIKAIYKAACLAELSALKPGNVHIFADGHGMKVQDFIKSAEVSSEVIAQPLDNTGQRILKAVNATWAAVSCNTNLGIILLVAPLIQSSYFDSPLSFNQKLKMVLNALTQSDAIDAYQAINKASPAGLASSEREDVHQLPTCTLLEAMHIAASRDKIAFQYANTYQDIDLGLEYLNRYTEKWGNQSWAISLLYLYFLSSFEDTHIIRKLGIEVATEVRNLAKLHFDIFSKHENPKIYQKALMDFDKALKEKGINPGSSADLTVATVMLKHLQALN